MNWAAFIAKAQAVVAVLQNSPQLLAALKAVIGIFLPSTPGEMKAASAPQLDELRAAFEACPELHSAMRQEGVMEGVSISDLYNEFLEFLPIIAQILKLFGATA